MYGCESWTVKKAECWRIDAFELWCWRRLLRVPCTARTSNQSILKEISPEYWKEGLKLQYFGHLVRRTDSLEKRPWCWERLKAGGEGDDRGWVGWMASLTQWTWVWVDSGSWWWTREAWHAGFKRGRGTRDQIFNMHWITEKAREFQKGIYFCFIDYTKAFDYVDHNKLWKILQEMGILDHLTCLLRNQEARVRTSHGTGDWVQIGKGVHQGYISSPCLFNLYVEYEKFCVVSIISRNQDCCEKHQ